MSGQDWIREQELAVLYLKVEIGKNGLTQKHPVIGKLAKAMERTEAAIWMRKGNFDALDNSVAGVGLKNVAKHKTQKVWTEYQANPDKILAEAFSAYSYFVNNTNG